MVVLLAAAINPALAWRLQGNLRRTLATPYVTVRLVGWPTAVVTGEFARVTVIVRRATIRGLVVDEFAARLRGARLDPLQAGLRGQIAVRAVDSGSATVRLLQEDVQRAVQDRPYVEAATVRFADNMVSLASTVKVAGAQVEVSLAGRLVVEDTRYVVLRVETMTVSGLALPAGVANLVIAPLNPLLSVNALPVSLRLTGVEVSDGQAVITAEAQ